MSSATSTPVDFAHRPRSGRVLTWSSAMFWGLQSAFLTPVIGLLLVSLYGATASEVGIALAVYNAAGFVASITIPALADRRRNYLVPLLACGAMTLVLAGVLALTTSLGLAVVALIVLGGPAGIGTSLMFADMRHAGAKPVDVINTRAIVSFAWVAGPPVATLVMGALGNRSILPTLAVVAALNILTTLVQIRRRRAAVLLAGPTNPPIAQEIRAVRRGVLVAILAGFVLLAATNSATTSTMSLFVTHRLHLPLIWAGLVLGLAALLEIPAFMLIGRMTGRISNGAILVAGCVVGIVYYVAMALLRDPITLLAVQPLNAFAFATVSGVGLTLFQDLIPGPGLASGMYLNTRKVGAIVAGFIITAGSATALGYQGTYAIAAVATVAALALVEVTRRMARAAD